MMSKSLILHKNSRWKIEIISKMPLKTREDLSLAYTPWVADACLEIAKNKDLAYDYTSKWNLVAVVSDGTAVLWLWDIWPEAWMPVMEWKAILFKEFWWVDAFPLCIATKNVDEIVQFCKLIEPTFWWINLEDISAPRCFEIEKRLKEELNIPVFHDDQHGTAIVVLAWMINACKITNRKFEDLKIVISWSWAAWIACCKILLSYWVKNIILFDSKWAISKDRNDLTDIKIEMSQITNPENFSWTFEESFKWRDVFIWLSKPWVVTQDMIRSMNKDAIIFAMANPIPEIMPEEAKKAWALVIATWRSDFPNQVNNVLAFPWIFRWVLDVKAKQITEEMKIAAAEAIAAYVQEPNPDNIIPYALDRNIWPLVAEAVKKCV